MYVLQTTHFVIVLQNNNTLLRSRRETAIKMFSWSDYYGFIMVKGKASKVLKLTFLFGNSNADTSKLQVHK